MLHPPHIQIQANRCGFSVVLVLGLLTIVASAIFVASTFSVSGSQQTSRFENSLSALQAVTAVLMRRERDVSRLAEMGEAANFAKFKDTLGYENYGVDFVGNVEVRWKIEPARTAQTADTEAEPDTEPSVPFIENPSPDPAFTPEFEKQIPNGWTYMYRVSAEGRFGNPDEEESLVGTARAQGVRYVAITRSPLFKYVLYYVQNGPRGDLELSHADEVKINGNVYSNGSIYLGSGLKVNDKLMQRGSIDAALKPSGTLIGQSNSKVSMRGLDGIFRLSKPLMFSIINELPLTSTPNTDAGAAVGNWTSSGSFVTDPGPYPTETSAAPNSATIAGITSSGKIINPYRFKTASGAVTIGPNTTLSNYPSGDDNLRAINNKALRGKDADTANDSRDAERASNRKWPVVANADFQNFIRTQVNGMVTDRPTASFAGRSLEPQTLAAVEFDSDSSTVDHEYFRPLFVDATSGQESTTVPDIASVQIEKPGFHLSRSLGTDNLMVRLDSGYGWNVRRRDALSAIPDLPAENGLIIRERPIPHPDYWPDTNTVPVVSQNSPRYMPYAYGKHWYPEPEPFSFATVSDNLIPQNPLDADTPPSVRANINRWSSFANYLGDGRVEVAGAAYPGPNASNRPTGSSTFNRNGTWSNVKTERYAGLDYYGIGNKQFYHRDPWHFVHLNKMRASTTSGSMHLVCYNDPFTRIEVGTHTDSSLPYAGDERASGFVAVTNGQLAYLGGAQSPATYPAGSRWSARWHGMLRPPSNGWYRFSVNGMNAGDTVRIWVGRNHVYESVGSLLGPVRLLTVESYPLVVELARTTTGPFTGTPPRLVWSRDGGANSDIPTTAIFRPVDNTAFPRSQFTFIETRIENPRSVAGPESSKFGLMIRPEQVASPVLQGASAYGMIGWSLSRGFFTQRRQVASTQAGRVTGLFFVGSATGSSDGEVTSQTAEKRGKLTQVSPTASLSTRQDSESFPTSTNRSIVHQLQPTTTVPTGSVSIGGGVQWQLLDSFSIGSYLTAEKWRPSKFRQNQYFYNQVVELTDADANFLATDNDKLLRIFTHAPPSTGTTSLGVGGRMGFNTTPGLTWHFVTNSAGTTFSSVPTRFLRRQYWSVGSLSQGLVQYAPEVTGVYKTLGSDTTAWRPKDTKIRIRKNGTTVTEDNLSDINTYLSSLGYSQQITVIKDGFPDYPDLPDPVGGSALYPSDASCPAGATPIDPVGNVSDMTAGHTFAVERGTVTPFIDSNPWISTDSTWFATPVANLLPRGALWPDGTDDWTGTPNTWPTTGGFRADVWSGAAASAQPTAASGVTEEISGLTFNSAGVSAGTGNGYAMGDDEPTASTHTEIWLRIVRDAATNTISFWGYNGTARPTAFTVAAGWRKIGNDLSIGNWGTHLLAGPCVQSGDINSAARATFGNLRVSGTWTGLAGDVDNDSVLDADDWDAPVGSSDNLALYLMSQYQVFFGPHEITEDFFSYRDANGIPLASEDWFYNNREFWSQSRWWDHQAFSLPAPANQPTVTTAEGFRRLEKDPATTVPSFTTTIRALLAKVTVLSLNMDVLQEYLRSRTVEDAEADVITGVGPDLPTLPSGTGSLKLRELFNGVIYAARTNRYPWNPNSNPNLASETGATGRNPYSSDPNEPLPNEMSAPNGDDPLLVNGDRYTRSHGLGSFAKIHDGVNLLQPYTLDQAPAFKPQAFWHGVRIQRAESIHWNFNGTGTPGSIQTNAEGKRWRQWTHSTTDAFGTSAMSIITPNALYVRGNLNVDEHQVTYQGANAYKPTPLAIMGDSITFMSRNWEDFRMQSEGLGVNNDGITWGNSLAAGNNLPTAASSFYAAGIVTNNLPTTKSRIIEGQAAPFVDTIQFLENWSGQNMGYTGSLVVLDERRYTKAFLLDVPKEYGTTPFGITTRADAAWATFFPTRSSGTLLPTADKWNGISPVIYREPKRIYEFNQDFTTAAGTPPGVPFGLTAVGVGGWARPID